jgi:hypothetical protein
VSKDSVYSHLKEMGNFPIFQSAGKTGSKPEGRIVTSATSRTGEFPPYFYLGEWIESPRKGSFFAHLFALSFPKTPSFLLTYLPTFKLLIFFSLPMQKTCKTKGEVSKYLETSKQLF